MKNVSTSTSRLLGAALLGLLFAATSLPRVFAAPDPAIATARADLASRDFAGMKAALDPYIATNVVNNEAFILRAIARAGIAAETKVSPYVKLSGGTAKVDFSTGSFSLDFPQVATFRNNAAFGVSGSSYIRRNATFSNNTACITFLNNGTASYPLALKFKSSGSSPDQTYFEGSVDVDGDDSAYLWGGGGLNANVYNDILTFVNMTQTLVAKLAPGHALTIKVYAASNLTITPKTALPQTILAMNGKSVSASRAKLTPGTGSDGFFDFLKNLDDTVLAPIVADLVAVTSGAQVALSPAQTGHPARITVAYADVRLMLAAIRFTQAMRLLSSSFDLGVDFQGGAILDADALATFRDTPAFFSVKPTSPAADRARARALFNAAITYYLQADAAGLWTRQPPAMGSYLVAIDPTAIQTRTNVKNEMLNFRNALNTPVLLAMINPDSLNNPFMPTRAGISFAPLFAATPVDLRALIPQFSDTGFIPGTSTPLLTSGLITNGSTVWWEDLLSSVGLTDPVASPVNTPASIRTQPVISTRNNGGAGELALLSGPATTGDFVLFEAVVLGHPEPTYQWRKNGKAIPGATKDYYYINSVTTQDAGNYDLVIKNRIINGGSKITSSKVTLAVNAP